MSTILMPGTVEMERLRLEMRALHDNSDWNGLWSRLRTLPPLLAIEAMQMMSAAWAPEGNDLALFSKMSVACRNTYLSDFEKLSRSGDEACCLPKPHSSRSLEGTPDGKWIIQVTESELRVLEPDTFTTKKHFEFYSVTGEVTEPLRIAISNDGKKLAVVSAVAHHCVFRVSIISLETFETFGEFIFLSYFQIPAIAFRSGNHLLVAGMRRENPSPESNPVEEIQRLLKTISEYEQQEAQNEWEKGSIQYLESRYLESRIEELRQLVPAWEGGKRLQEQAIKAGGIVDLDISTGNWTSIKVSDAQIRRIAIDIDGKYMAFVEHTSELHGCCPQDMFQLKVLQLSDGKVLLEKSHCQDDILNVMFAEGGYLISEQAYQLTIFAPQTWEVVRRFDSPGSEYQDDRPRSHCTPDGRVLVFLEGNPHESRDQIRIIGFPELSELAQYPLHSFCSKERWPMKMKTLTICGNRLFAETGDAYECTGMHSMSMGLRNTGWDYATELRKISCTPICMISEEVCHNLFTRAAKDRWLTPQQQRWLDAVASSLEFRRS